MLTNWNWKKIKSEHPLAWKELKKKFNINILSLSIFDGTQLRDLYDFFDEQGIIIEIKWYITSFRYNVWSDNEVKSANHKKTRFESELMAFEKAFDVLEEKLNKI